MSEKFFVFVTSPGAACEVVGIHKTLEAAIKQVGKRVDFLTVRKAAWDFGPLPSYMKTEECS